MALLLQIDDLVRSDHYYLDKNDHCYYFHEFIAGGGYNASAANNLISNFKKEMKRKGAPEWKYKSAAIRSISDLLIESLPSFIDNNETTFIPIPPSKCKSNPEYDDRLMQVLLNYQKSYEEADVKEMLTTKRDTTAVHTSSQKRDVRELYANLEIDKLVCKDLKRTVVLFDDVITTGAHFKACKQAIERCPQVEKIIGIFVARRSIQATAHYDFSDIDI